MRLLIFLLILSHGVYAQDPSGPKGYATVVTTVYSKDAEFLYMTQDASGKPYVLKGKNEVLVFSKDGRLVKTISLNVQKDHPFQFIVLKGGDFLVETYIGKYEILSPEGMSKHEFSVPNPEHRTACGFVSAVETEA